MGYFAEAITIQMVLHASYLGVIACIVIRHYCCSMPKEAEQKVVTIVDDDELMRHALAGVLKAAGLQSRMFGSAEEFLNSGVQYQTGCLIADVRMPGMSGLELQAKLDADHCTIPTIFITAHGDTKMRMEALRAGAVEFLTKPFDNAILLQHVRAAIES
jgi:FixJ family two-component response regulator